MLRRKRSKCASASTYKENREGLSGGFVRVSGTQVRRTLIDALACLSGDGLKNIIQVGRCAVCFEPMSRLFVTLSLMLFASFREQQSALILYLHQTLFRTSQFLGLGQVGLSRDLDLTIAGRHAGSTR